MADFDWNALLGPPTYSYVQPTLATTSNSAPALPSLVHSSASSPDSTESSEASPNAHGNDIIIGASSHKRKDLPGSANATVQAAHKDLKQGREMQHSHDTQEGKPTSTGSNKTGKVKGQVSEKRRDQNRAAQKAFRERKEKHVKDLEDRVAELESQGKDRDSQNDNLRALVEQLRQENERLSAGQGTFAKSSFTFDVPSASTSTSNLTSASPSVSPSALTAPPAKLSPPVAFPAVSIGGLGADFLAELSGQPLRKPSYASTSSFSSSSAAASLPDPLPPTSFDLFTPNGQHVNFGGSMANASPLPFGDWRDGGKVPELDDYFVGLGSPPPTLPSAPATSTTMAGGDGDCPYKGVLADDDLNSLCSEMKNKATCQEYARKALEDALKQDISTHAQLTGGSSSLSHF